LVRPLCRKLATRGFNKNGKLQTCDVPKTDRKTIFNVEDFFDNFPTNEFEQGID